ncbi:hypothetical protein MOV66_02565 [Agrobacterium sp. SHOUNA12C]|nr:hypothetical protein [Agrobacterium sp. BETTINA12B]MCJ9755516.1 hypothetical protein [Agrobacterium sp. SHOUNA12C]NTG34776.1 hypothetical protein [Rhizobium rhizogenes]NTG54025.1 hypothetical protein [Rhizobium rhizogenes]
MVENIFVGSYRRVSTAQIEFDHFRDKAPAWVQELKQRNPRLMALEAHFGCYVRSADHDTFQVNLGKRSTFRKNNKGATVVENGSSLVYSLGPTGDVATFLYPCNSELGAPFEGLIMIRIGKFSGYQLLQFLEADLKAFIRYTYVTSLDTTPTNIDRWYIKWLRFTRAMQIDEKHQEPKIKAFMGATGKSLGSAFAGALFGPIALLIVSTVVIWFGWHQFANLLFPPNKP